MNVGQTTRAGLLAEVLFDSSLEPLPVGVRSAASSSRQLLFGVEDLRIDLRLEPKMTPRMSR